MNRYEKELQTLRRENQRLRKMLQRAEDTVSGFSDRNFEEEVDAEEEVERVEKKKVKKDKKFAKAEAKGKVCPDCGALTEDIRIGPFTLQFCIDRCGYRKKVT